MNIPVPEWVQSFSLLSRREDIPVIARFEAHVSHLPFRDDFNRGCGDVWGHGYSRVSLDEALTFALANCLEAKAKRLEDRNANLTYSVPKLETPAKPLSGAFAGITLDL